MDHKLTQAAATLREAEQKRLACTPIRDIIGVDDISGAYSIQQINTDLRLANGERRIGKKIGLTSFAVQKQLGVDQPDFGMLFHSMQIQPGDTLSAQKLIQPKAEAEIAFVLKKDLTKDINLNNLIDSIDYACVAIEIVDSRVENWNIKITDTVADNASASHFVLGNERMALNNLDLVGCKMKLFKNDVLVSEGSGAACMDNPLNAVLWLAKTMEALGQPLQKNEIILSGALGPMTSFEKGDVIKTSIEGLGEVGFICD